MKEFGLTNVLKIVFLHFEGWAIVYYVTWLLKGEIPETLVQVTLGACAIEVFLTAAIKIADKIKKWKLGITDDDELETFDIELDDDYSGGNG